ncbi:NAD(P)-binding Rossmann-fold superfamily protein [Striga asiatica]|uniref:NAD(P)-binding Rossmann-fold superfamily protein n=1 Tax=Striga asiatica TaxID=4170 RepID=A0A5A7RD93_STRAF|nr:NAD(P)-binding Rossmann-fold superfamily protein [Striga asiatica]
MSEPTTRLTVKAWPLSAAEKGVCSQTVNSQARVCRRRKLGLLGRRWLASGHGLRISVRVLLGYGMASPNCRNLLPNFGFASQQSAANKARLGIEVRPRTVSKWSPRLCPVECFRRKRLFSVAIRGPTLTFEARSVALTGKSGGSRFDNERPRGCSSAKSPVSLARNRLSVNGSVLRSWFPPRLPSPVACSSRRWVSGLIVTGD